MASRALVGRRGALTELLEQRDRRAREIRTSRVVGRNTDGTTQLLDLEGECIARGCITAEARGETVRRPVGSCFRGVGTTGIATLSLRIPATWLWVESLDPAEYEAGQSYTVEVVGYGFTAGTRFEFLLPSSEQVSPWIEITGQTWIDSRHVELAIAVSPDAPALVGGGLAFDAGGGA